MAKSDLLKEAIADAKAVKETALANAKMALEEAFTPKLQSMLSHKIAEELDEDDIEFSDTPIGEESDEEEEGPFDAAQWVEKYADESERSGLLEEKQPEKDD